MLNLVDFPFAGPFPFAGVAVDFPFGFPGPFPFA